MPTPNIDIVRFALQRFWDITERDHWVGDDDLDHLANEIPNGDVLVGHGALNAQDFEDWERTLDRLADKLHDEEDALQAQRSDVAVLNLVVKAIKDHYDPAWGDLVPDEDGEVDEDDDTEDDDTEDDDTDDAGAYGPNGIWVPGLGRCGRYHDCGACRHECDQCNAIEAEENATATADEGLTPGVVVINGKEYSVHATD